jgi:hypothetical protein
MLQGRRELAQPMCHLLRVEGLAAALVHGAREGAALSILHVNLELALTSAGVQVPDDVRVHHLSVEAADSAVSAPRALCALPVASCEAMRGTHT